MGAPCPPHWTFAARAAYFGDRMCAFCDHRNPADAKFCNDCASPLQLKPCKQCDAVNDQAATNCYKCGAAYPASSSTSEATPASQAAATAPASVTPGDVAVAATVTQPLFATSLSQARWRLLGAAIPAILIAGAYAAYRIGTVTPDPWKGAPQTISAVEHDEPAAMPAAPVAVESKPVESEPVEPGPVEPEITAPLQAPIPTTTPEAPKRASARQRPEPAGQAPVGATPPVKHSLASARVGARVAETRGALPPHPWQMMHVGLARCDGELIARIVCELRVRQRFCEGRWGEAPECTSGITNDHGQ
jgi:ribosomal protein L40E